MWAESGAVWLEGGGQLADCRLKDRRSGQAPCRDEGLTDLEPTGKPWAAA